MIMRSKPVIAGTVLLFLAVVVKASLASEYLGNNQRTGYTDATIPAKPALLWTYKERHAPKTAWPQVTRSGRNFIVVPVEGSDDAAGFRFNSDFTPITGTTRQWIYSSGLTGEIELKVLGVEQKTYRMLLHFMEPEQLQKGDRVFDVLINGKTLLSQVDIIGETGAPNKALVKGVKGIGPSTTIEFSLKHISGKPPLLCGIEVIPE